MLRTARPYRKRDTVLLYRSGRAASSHESMVRHCPTGQCHRRSAGVTIPCSVPPAGERISVKTAVSQNAPQENEGVMRHGNISSALVEEARTAVDAVGLRLAAVEVVTPDTSMALREAGGIVLEVNAPPGLHYHYQIAEPEYAVRVAVPILKRLLEG